MLSSWLQDSSSLTQTTALPHAGECTNKHGSAKTGKLYQKAKDTGNFRFGSRSEIHFFGLFLKLSATPLSSEDSSASYCREVNEQRQKWNGKGLPWWWEGDCWSEENACKVKDCSWMESDAGRRKENLEGIGRGWIKCKELRSRGSYYMPSKLSLKWLRQVWLWPPPNKIMESKFCF